MIKNYIYVMALWNILKEERNYSVQEILEIKYRVDFLLEKKIEVKKIKEEELENMIKDIVENDVEAYDMFYGKINDYIGNEIKRLRKMLDAIVGKENTKLIYEKRKEKIYTKSDCLFFFFLFTTYHLEDGKKMKKGQYSEISQDYIDYIYKSVMELTENENLKLSKDAIKQMWERRYHKTLRVFENDCIEFLKSFMKVFKKAIKIYKKRLIYVEYREGQGAIEYDCEILDRISLELTKCLWAIQEIDEEFTDIAIYKIDYDEELKQE